MAYVKIWIHVVWGTKNRTPVLLPDVRKTLFQHIRENASAKDIQVDFINGFTDHVHCLIRLRAEQNIAKAVQLLKGESAYWANKNSVLPQKLEWAEEYFAVSVSESMIETVRTYIRNQEEHHQKMPFAAEYKAFMDKYGFVDAN